MLKFEVGKKIPIEVGLEKASGERAFANIDGSINVFLVLNNITKSEMEEFNGDLSVILQEYEVPILVLKYKSMSFDMPLLHGNISENILNIYIVSFPGYILKHQRMLGLNDDFFEAVKTNIQSIDGMDEMSVYSIVNRHIYPKYSPKDMCKGGVRQRFEIAKK